MKFKDYERLAQRTANENSDSEFMISIMGLSGEIGEVVDVVYLSEIENLDKKEKIKEEIGDILWYLTDIAKKTNLDLPNLILNPIYEDMPKLDDIGQFQAMLREYICEKAAVMTNENTSCRQIQFNKKDPISLCLLLTKSSLTFVNEMKKVLGHGHEMPKDSGKMLFLTIMCLFSLASSYQIDMNEVAAENIKKLEKRYPNGFSFEDSINRII